MEWLRISGIEHTMQPVGYIFYASWYCAKVNRVATTTTLSFVLESRGGRRRRQERKFVESQRQMITTTPANLMVPSTVQVKQSKGTIRSPKLDDFSVLNENVHRLIWNINSQYSKWCKIRRHRNYTFLVDNRIKIGLAKKQHTTLCHFFN